MLVSQLFIMKKEHQPDPEALYGLYKETRSRPVTAEAGSKESAADGLTADAYTADEVANGDPAASDLADKVYKRYQETRNAESVAIDEIMRGIQALPDGEQSALIEEQPLIHSSEADVKSVGSPVGPFSWLSKLTTAGNDGPPMAKFILPAVAAAVFAFVLLPLINTKNNVTDSPDNFAYLSPLLAPYVEPLNTEMLGFSNPENERGNAFQYGVLAADLQVFRNSAGDAEPLKKVVQSYLMDSSNNPEEVNLAAQQIVALSSTGVEDTEVVISPEIVESIDALVSATQNHAGYAKFTDWYLLGQSVEAVVLSSEHALATSDTSVLQSAIDHGKTLSVPDDAPELKELLDDLFAEVISNSMQPADIRRILSNARDIKSVVL